METGVCQLNGKMLDIKMILNRVWNVGSLKGLKSAYCNDYLRLSAHVKKLNTDLKSETSTN